MVVADLGSVEMADPHFRLVKKLRPDMEDVGVCTPNYRAPDIFLGNQRYSEDADMWAFGCLVVELVTRKPLVIPEGEPSRGSERTQEPHPKAFVDRIRQILGIPGMEPGTRANSNDPAKWLDSLPFFQKWYRQSGSAWLQAEEVAGRPRGGRGEWPVPGLEDSPKDLVHLAEMCLNWQPSVRATLSEARQCLFLQPPGEHNLRVRMSMQKGKNGTGTIAEGELDADLLRFLQNDFCWDGLAKQRLNTGATHSKCVRGDEAAKGLKTEIAGIVDEQNPPKCRSLNRDTDLQRIPSERFSAFVRALKRKWRPWLQQLGDKMRTAVADDRMPQDLIAKNGTPIMEEDFADNAFAYASIQLMQPGERDDGWHTDGGCSLLHAAVTLFGTRAVQVKTEDKTDIVTLEQEPGCFYVGTLAALDHNVHHHASDDCKDTFQTKHELEQEVEDRRLQIAVMIRSDVFREFRARRIGATPGPAEFFHVVNHAVAEHLAHVPVKLPDLTEVLDEVRSWEEVTNEILDTADAGGLTD